MDAAGNLTQVVEPNPAGGTFTTNYTYDLLTRLTLVSMPRGASTQTRSWNYDSTTQRLTSLTNPENGTVSFTLNAADGTVATKTDAKIQQTQYTYDVKKRVTQIAKAGDACQTVPFSYDTNTILPGFSANTSDYLATMSYFIKDSVGCEAVQEIYSYTAAGAITNKRLRMFHYPVGLDLDAVYTYDTEGRDGGVGDIPRPVPWWENAAKSV